MLTDNEVRYGYWDDKYSRNQDTPPITEVSEYTGQDVLRVSCTQIYPPANQKRIVSEWCAALPQLDGVKTLCFNSRVTQSLFDAASLMPGLEALYVKWGGIKTVASILGSKRLQVLTLGSNPAIQDIGLLGEMTGLRCLS